MTEEKKSLKIILDQAKETRGCFIKNLLIKFKNRAHDYFNKKNSVMRGSNNEIRSRY